MQLFRQRTIACTAEVEGFGLFGSADCRLRFQPAEPGAGIAFRRVDRVGSRPVPARIEYVQKVPRRTAISDGRSVIETIEHVMAALAGLAIDNCLVELDALEPPIGDGSSLHFVNALLAAGIVEQPGLAAVHSAAKLEVAGSDGQVISSRPDRDYAIRYSLDYGPGSPIPAHAFEAVVTPETFIREVAGARTFVLATEIEGLRSLGYGQRATTDNLLVFDDRQVRDNALRWPDECARHKLLDAIGDFALCGSRLQGRFHARKAGHHLNHEMARRLTPREVRTSQSTRRAA